MGRELRNKTCLNCGEEFVPTGGSQKYCEKCRLGPKSDYKRRDRIKLRIYHRNRYRKNRQVAINLLGRVCAKCGFDDPRALQIDHVNGGGTRERRLKKNTSARLLMDVINDRSGKYQLLCANCNWIKRSENGEFICKEGGD